MLTRNLVLLHDRRPMMTSITPGPIRARILEWPEDDADLFTVWSVPIDDSMAQPHDITQQFALDWAAQLQFGDGIEPHDYLAPIPAFVRHACGAKLDAIWRSRMEQRSDRAA